MCIRPLNERSLKLSHQKSSFFQTTPKEDEIKEFHKRRFSQLICHQMKVLGKWPEKLFLLDTPFEVTITTKHAISAEDSSCVSPLYERKGTRTVLQQLGPFWGPCSWSLLGFSEAGREQGWYPGSALPWAHHRAHSYQPKLSVCPPTAAGGTLKGLSQLPKKIQWRHKTYPSRIIWGWRSFQIQKSFSSSLRLAGTG